MIAGALVRALRANDVDTVDGGATLTGTAITPAGPRPFTASWDGEGYFIDYGGAS